MATSPRHTLFQERQAPTCLPPVRAGLCGLRLCIRVGPRLTEAEMGGNVAGVGTLMWDRV